MTKVSPIKRFGQHFLVDKNIIKKIIEEVNPSQNDLILEIGPGQGALTRELIDSKFYFFAIEVDKRVCKYLINEFPNLKIFQEDFLKFEFSEIPHIESREIRIVGNIPYNITSPIIYKLLSNRKVIKDAILMLQSEVANKITSSTGSKEYGILGVLLNYFTNVKVCFKIPPTAFYPKPKVNSALVHLIFKNLGSPIIDDDLFIDIVKASFGNRRKTIKNSLSNSIFNIYNFSSAPIDLSKRAEELTTKDFIKLSKFIQEQRNGR